MKHILLAFVLLVSIINVVWSQNRRALFIQAEYQLIHYKYVTIGLGYQPQKHLLESKRKHPTYSFTGWTMNYIKKLDNSDWGLSVQTVLYNASSSGPFGIGMEGNYKSIEGINHFSLKPIIGISFPIVSIMYAYNFDLYKLKFDRVSQHELILGLRLPLKSGRK